MEYEVIGEYLPGNEENETPPVIRRGILRQGKVYKNGEAFYKEPERICYVPELTDTPYTRNDFLKLSLGQEDMAEIIFISLDWQEPEAWLEEQYRTGEMDVCRACGHLYESYGVEACPYCGFKIENKWRK